MLFTLNCYGGAMSDGTSSTNIALNWKDTTTLQTAATPLLSTSYVFATSTAFGVAPTLNKRFNS